ncbi:MAG: cytochrome c peroxidase, partial [Pseudobdellovibrionaceae bacterium]
MTHNTQRQFVTILLVSLLSIFFQACGGKMKAFQQGELASVDGSSNLNIAPLAMAQFDNSAQPMAEIFGNGNALTPDGRLWIGTGPIDGNYPSNWFIRTVRPEGSSRRADGSPAINYGPSYLFGLDQFAYEDLKGSTDPLFRFVQLMPIRQLNTLTIMFDDSRLAPFKSDSLGNENAKGDHLTYAIKIITPNYSFCEGTAPYVGRCNLDYPLDKSFFGFFRFKIVIANPYSDKADIVRVQKIEDFKPMMMEGNHFLTGIEPSITAGGHLLVFNANNLNRKGDNPGDEIKFTIHSDPFGGDLTQGWSPPLPIAQLYDQRFKQIRLPNGTWTTLGERYPIAKKPLLDDYGKRITSSISSAYPWISLDGLNLMFTTNISNDRAIRAGLAVTGAWTNGHIRHIDGGGNLDRHHPTMLVVTSFDTQAWSPFPLRQPIPVSPKNSVLSMLQSNTARYFEVAFEESKAQDYDLYMEMNEGLTAGAAGSKQMMFYDTVHVSDISGQFFRGFLQGGAAFPDEFENCGRDQVVTGQFGSACRTLNPYSGKSVYFPGGSNMMIRGVSPTGARHFRTDSTTVSFAMKLLTAPSAPVHLLYKEGVIAIHLLSEKEMRATIVGPRGSFVHDIPVSLGIGLWTHLTFLYDGKRGTIETLVNGNSINISPQYGDIGLQQNDNPLYLGPINNASVLYQLDQVAVSSFIRNRNDINRQLNVYKVPKVLDAPKGLRFDDTPSVIRLPTVTKAELGKHLFFDTRLSSNGTVSCSTCHKASSAWTDGLRTALGFNGKTLTRNTPGLFNMGFNDSFFYDGRSATLEDQAHAVISNPDEMNNDLGIVQFRLQKIQLYKDLFRNAFGTSEITVDKIKMALADFQMSLLSGDSRVDRFELGDKTALTDIEQLGRNLFRGKAQCATCHSGSSFTDSQFHNTGFFNDSDTGRAQAVPFASQVFRFKTPCLRNLSRTAPYFHNGS